MISVLTVSYNCQPWLELLVKSVRKHSRLVSEIVVVDNGSEDGTRGWLIAQPDVKATLRGDNIGHGRGLDAGMVYVKPGNSVLVLDADAHITRPGWDEELMWLYGKDATTRLIAAQGNDRKPVHPCVMFFERDWFLDNHLSFVARDGYDVGRKLYPDTLALGGNVTMLPVGYEGYANGKGIKLYEGAWGDTYYLNDRHSFYHNWYSSRMFSCDEVDGYKHTDHDANARKVFDNPRIKEILAWGRPLETRPLS
ncbi:MAG: glycosyltransferase family 2 protein [Chloroflexi bacterium]|nr:glycosyltransferase family 2 protein [Chloroflexota bacterium]